MLSRKENWERHSFKLQTHYKKYRKILKEYHAVFEDKCEFDLSRGRNILPPDIDIYYRYKIRLVVYEIFFILLKMPIRYDDLEFMSKRLGLSKEEYFREYYEESKKERFAFAIKQFDSYNADFYGEYNHVNIDLNSQSIDLKKYLKFAYPDIDHSKRDDSWQDEIENERVNTLKKDLKSFDDWEGGRGRSQEAQERQEIDDLFSSYYED